MNEWHGHGVWVWGTFLFLRTKHTPKNRDTTCAWRRLLFCIAFRHPFVFSDCVNQRGQQQQQQHQQRRRRQHSMHLHFFLYTRYPAAFIGNTYILYRLDENNQNHTHTQGYLFSRKNGLQELALSVWVLVCTLYPSSMTATLRTSYLKVPHSWPYKAFRSPQLPLVPSDENALG